MYFEIRDTDIDRHLQSEEARALLATLAAKPRAAAACAELRRVLGDAILRAAANLMVVTPSMAATGATTSSARLAEEKGDHWRGEPVSELGEPDRSFVRRAALRLTTRRKEPTYAVHSAPNAHNVLLWERLMLPCRECGRARPSW